MKIRDKLSAAPSYVIFGAHAVAYGAYVAVYELSGKKPECFLVSSAEGNPSEVDGFEVRTLSNYFGYDSLVIIAVTDLFQPEVARMLHERGFTNTFSLNSHEEHSLMSGYFQKKGMFPLLEHTLSDTGTDGFAVYEAKNHSDKPLLNPPGLTDWEKTLQAGTALTKVRLAPLSDDTGDNISFMNKQLSELTVTYWVWKNTSHHWKGICHYRRRLDITPGQIAALPSGGTDVILPLPYICCPYAVTHIGNFISRDVVELLLKALKALYAGDYSVYESLLFGRYQYCYNMLCAREEVFDDYAGFLFSVLFYMDDNSKNIPEIKNTRALSYVGELLTSVYFMANKGRLTIKHVKKMIYV